jgi:hypothetical protein
MSARSADELSAGYEALRATALGSVVFETPRGWALFLAQGLPAWVRTFCALAPAPPIVPLGERRPVTSGLGADVVRVLTEMVLGCRTTLAAS